MDAELDPETILSCAPVSDGAPQIPGSTASNCSKCDVPVWIAPSSREIMIETDPVLLCPKCTNEFIERDKTRGITTEFERFTPDQRREIEGN